MTTNCLKTTKYCNICLWCCSKAKWTEMYCNICLWCCSKAKWTEMYYTFSSILQKVLPRVSIPLSCYKKLFFIKKAIIVVVLYFISSHLKSSSYTMSTMQFHSNTLSITAKYNLFEKRIILTPLLEF